MNISPRVADRVARDFLGKRTSQVLELLSSLDLGGTSIEGDERICGAILIIADGDLDRLINAAAEAEIDWRDVLVLAGLENEDWPQRLDDVLGPGPTDP
ncbi:MAG: hypothetical protein E4H24_01765 [Thermomicrobiales bacterium]|nr:MAG: hypothetical protein E4H24_01765 [Thermomicrobiales bacterium]